MSENHPHSRLEQAKQRLAHAIGRLEAALDAKGADVVPELAEELSRLHTENSALKGQMGQAATRLEATIAHFKVQMEGEA